MGFCVGAYGSVWNVEIREKSTKLSFVVSKKEKGSDPPVYNKEFRNYVMLLGEAHKKAAETIGLKDGDRIKILNCDVRTPQDTKNPDVYYTNFLIFDWEPAGSGSSSNQTAKPTAPAKSEPKPVVEEEDEDDLPF